MKKMNILAVLSMAFVLVSCGKGTNPLDTIDPPSGNGAVDLEFPAQPAFSTGITPYQQGGLTEVSGIRVLGSGKVDILSPAKGLVIGIVKEQNNASSNTTIFNGTFRVEILIDQSVTVHVRLLDSVTVGIGDQLNPFQKIGVSTGNSNTITQVDVYVDGRLTCPYSYFSLNGRQVVLSKLTSAQRPCNN